ncbi:hypothetical protein Y032_0018g3491 [Ancylostoma ceylanicum]|uniref:Uncharacterized protein n=1 Tax=Ancylostoma ceylanicum TaxID=53326 RepID=A0A016V369_9BILA|nr:hypothetical protein Y032_0018g3491 [Ancylostoma ceylanicum]
MLPSVRVVRRKCSQHEKAPFLLHQPNTKRILYFVVAARIPARVARSRRVLLESAKNASPYEGHCMWSWVKRWD